MRRLMIAALPLFAAPALAQDAASDTADQACQPSASCAAPANPAPMAILSVDEFASDRAPPQQFRFREDSVAQFYNQRHAPADPAESGDDLYSAPGARASGERSEYRAFGLTYSCEERADGTRCIGSSGSSTEGDDAANATQAEAERIVNERLDAMQRD